MTQQACIIHQLHFELGSTVLFDQLDFQLNKHKLTGLIGRNGQGKSQLLQCLLTQKNITGQVAWNCAYAFLPQQHQLTNQTIAQVLQIEDTLKALKRIECGQATFEDYDLAEGNWNLPQYWQEQLSKAGLTTAFDFPVTALSEGQKTKLALCRLFNLKDHYLLLDEPSNHLDASGRDWLISSLLAHPMGALVASHDRQLLNQMQHILALDNFGLHAHSGNYAHYKQITDTLEAALELSIDQHKRELKQQTIKQHETLMKQQKKQSTAKKKRNSGSQAKVILDFKQNKADQQLGQITRQQHRQLEFQKEALRDKTSRLEVIKAQQFEFSSTQPQSGELVRLNGVLHPYHCNLSFHFALLADEKLHLCGENGAGKSTLLHLIARLHTSDDSLFFKRARCLYLDQRFSFLDSRYSAVENLRLLNSEYDEVFWRNKLGQLRLRGDSTLRPIAQLSGGEQLKVALTALAYPAESIDLLLLDEPENYLDIVSRELLACAIRDFKGAVILVSHDVDFVRQCGIHQEIHMSEVIKT